jgi:formylglycine-generating enzyme required for sulfatase activity
MCRVAIWFLAAYLMCLTAVQNVSAGTIDTVLIDHAGNANDPATGNGFGGVAYNYRIAKYDVTIGQYTEFLNAVAATDTYSLYNPSMATNLNIAGISRSGASGSFSYSVLGSPNHPITYVSWGDAARFTNWLNNGQPTGAQGPSTTETGAYSLNGAITDADLNAVSRSAGAKWYLPTDTEWYKAAYYDPAAGHYWSYATGTNTTPTSAPPGSIPNTANYRGNTGYAVTGSLTLSSTQNYLTDVGAYTASVSPYGTFDQTGNVYQWAETLYAGRFRAQRGGDWFDNALFLPSDTEEAGPPTDELQDVGFRVATVPEPSTAALAVVAFGLMCARRKRSTAHPRLG